MQSVCLSPGNAARSSKKRLYLFLRSPHQAAPDELMQSVVLIAGWSSPVARQAHNLKAAGSNPAPATKSLHQYINHKARRKAGFVRSKDLI